MESIFVEKARQHANSSYGPKEGDNARSLALKAQSELDQWTPGAVDRDAPFQVLDFFCGCGGMSAGFKAVGHILPSFKVLGGCDINADALSSFTANFGVPGILQDLEEIDPSPSGVNGLLKRFPDYVPTKPLVLIGCAPCQGFTSHRKKNWDVHDKRNGLVEVFASLAVQLQPACIVMENVPELLSQKYWKHFQAAKAILDRDGYQVRAAIYNTAEFGVPQERFRAVVIAMKRPFSLPNPLFNSGEFVTVRDAIGHLPMVSAGEQDLNDAMHRSARHKQETLETIRAVPRNGGSRPAGVGPKCLDEVKGFYDVYGRLHWDRPAITVTHYARNPASGRYTHPEQDRGLTMREAALLQGFPIGYRFDGGFDSVFKQIGEAVPPKFACALAAHVWEMLNIEGFENFPETEIASLEKPVSSSYSSVIAGLKLSRRKA